MPVMNVREDFPILASKINGKDLIYLDNAATTQMPLCVMETLSQHYRESNANIHRGIHTLSERSTKAYESAREHVRAFINAEKAEEIVFTSGTTHSINMSAYGLEHLIRKGDSIIVSALEHHSNFLPWQRLCQRRGADLLILPCPAGDPDMEAYRSMLEKRPKIVALTQVSNLTGTVFPVKEMTELAHQAGAIVLIDGAQGIRHEITDVQDIGCDLYCFSGHKILAPSGTGVLYGKEEILEQMEPLMLGGGMVDTVTGERSSFTSLPSRLEAGTPNYAGAIALSAALDYIEKIGRETISQREHELTEYVLKTLGNTEGVSILGTPAQRSGVVSFNIDGVHPYDAASLLDKSGIALRSGTHCAQPGIRSLGAEYALRLSPAFYNTESEIDITAETIRHIAGLFA